MTINTGNDEIYEITIDGTQVREVTVDGVIAWVEANFDIRNLSAPNEVKEGDNFTVSADVKNIGDGRDTQNISFNRGGSTNKTLEGGETTTVSFGETINNTGNFNLSISSDDDSESRNITVESAIPDSDTLGFEDMTKWEVINGGQVSDRVFSGGFSYFSSADNTNEQATLNINSVQPSKIEYYYQETENSFGGGVRFFNSNGDDELGTGTDNPAFVVDSINGIDDDVGNSSDGQYDVWVEVVHDFNWGDDSVTVNFQRLDNSNSGQKTVSLKHGIDISSIELWNLNDTWGDGELDMWWDAFSITL